MRCPVCKADNVPPPQCRRCKADLSLLFTLEEQRRQTLAAARHSLRRGEVGEAIEHVETAEWLRDDEESRRLAALAHLLDRDFARAWECYQNECATERSNT